ncbi:hypothetical protein AX16_005090 [Volvariella volvacea WC 439]|nr:hypothetical protein AX16_005090 [Volvariella volvacea WC 439]
MSWQSYVDTNLVGSGRVSKAAIVGQQGGVWAASAGYNLTPEEVNAVINAFVHPDQVQASGLRFAGQKFFTLQVDPVSQTVQLKKAADGAIVRKTKQAILVAEYAAPIQQTECNVIVQQLGDYLVSVGY